MSNIIKGLTATIDGTAWKVLATTHNEALLLRDLIVDYRAFHGTPQPVTWKTSDLRRWLNDEYFPTLPTVLQEAALPVDVSDGISTASDTDGDRVFLLSADEARAYFPSDAGRRTSGSGGDPGWWWLRSPGNYQHNAASVSNGGIVNDFGYNVFLDSGGVRPALWVNLKSLNRILETGSSDSFGAHPVRVDAPVLEDVLHQLEQLSEQVRSLLAGLDVA
jgi:hypothetical protein